MKRPVVRRVVILLSRLQTVATTGTTADAQGSAEQDPSPLSKQPKPIGTGQKCSNCLEYRAAIGTGDHGPHDHVQAISGVIVYRCRFPNSAGGDKLGSKVEAKAMADSYDQVAYPGFAFPESHPDRLCVIGRLLGVDPAPATRCRVLELGCGDGSNLIPMALALPESDFVGIDLAAQPIARGCATAAELGLRNIRLTRMDVRDFPADAGPFDYIIAYGLYSWIPEDARRQVKARLRHRRFLPADYVPHFSEVR